MSQPDELEDLRYAQAPAPAGTVTAAAAVMGTVFVRRPIDVTLLGPETTLHECGAAKGSVLHVIPNVCYGGCGPSKMPESSFTAPLPAGHGLPPQAVEQSVGDSELQVLSRLDDRLCEVLAEGHIRLVRAAWLKSRPAGYRIQYRQLLEEIERQGSSPSPLLSPREAVAAIRSCSRSVGALTYGWLSPGVPRCELARVVSMCRRVSWHASCLAR